MTSKPDENSATQTSPLEVIYQDEALLVLNKPSGLLSVPGRGDDKQDSLASRVQAVYPEAVTVHRLDMSTSGLMVMARSLPIQRHMHRLFEQRQVKKTYIAVVTGQLEADHGVIDLPLISDWPNRPRQKVDHARGKPSLTRYRLLQYDPQANTSRLELEPVTGRSHQLRVHMLALGHAILGDPLYASASIQAMAPRLLLHAETVCFAHPLTAIKVRFHSSAPF